MGFADQMIVSLKFNKRERVSAFERIKNFKEGKNIKIYIDQKASLQDLKKIREKIQKENKTRFLKSVILLVLCLSIIIYFVGFFNVNHINFDW